MRADTTSVVLVAVALAVATAAGPTRADDARPAPPPAAAPAAAPRAGTPPKTFPSVEEAAKALFAAFESNDDAALRAIAGPGNEDLVQDGKDAAVAAQRRELARAAKSRLSFDRDDSDGRVLLVVGEVEYPLALPLVRADGGWRIDPEAGRRELLARRIGENELEAVGIALAYADAQVAYAREDRDGDGVREYAQRIASTPGARDGLRWDATDGEEESPLAGPLAPLREALEPTATPKPPPFNGYYWRVLHGQGPSAPGGAHSYLVNGNMIAGFALLGVPAAHRNTGVMSFLVSHHGKVFEKDLGPDTLRAAAAIEVFEPDASWREVDERTRHDAADSSPDDAPFRGDGPGGPVSPATPAGGTPAPGSVPAPRPGGACPGK
jgi:hypothetical protein